MKNTKKIIDFVHSAQIATHPIDLPKGTAVSFKLPKDQQYELEGAKVEVDLGTVLDRVEGEYTISYKNLELKIKRDDILLTKAQLEEFPILDALNPNVIAYGNDNDLINMKNRLLPESTPEEWEQITGAIESMGPKDGDYIVCYTTTDKDETPSQTHMDPIKIGDVYFNSYIK